MVCNNCALYMLLYKQCRGFYRCSKRVVNARSVFQEHHLVMILSWLCCDSARREESGRELVVEMVYSFLLPEVEKQTMRE